MLQASKSSQAHLSCHFLGTNCDVVGHIESNGKADALCGAASSGLLSSSMQLSINLHIDEDGV